MSTICYGPLNPTKNGYHWNSNVKGSGQINDKWMKEIVFFWDADRIRVHILGAAGYVYL